MSIVSSEVSEDHTQADGSRKIALAYTDHVGGVHIYRHNVAPGFDANAALIAGEPIVLNDLDLSEQDDAEPQVRGGADSLVVAQNPIHSTEKKLAKKLIRWMMREPDPRVIITMEPLVDFLRANYTNLQLANFLDVTLAQLIRINDRYNAIIAEKALLLADADRVEEINNG